MIDEKQAHSWLTVRTGCGEEVGDLARYPFVTVLLHLVGLNPETP